jgi:hypothetical protein
MISQANELDKQPSRNNANEVLILFCMFRLCLLDAIRQSGNNVGPIVLLVNPRLAIVDRQRTWEINDAATKHDVEWLSLSGEPSIPNVCFV